MTRMTLEQAIKLAVEQHQAGRLAEAEQIYRQILAADPHHAQTLNLLGVVASQNGQGDRAIELARMAIAAAPDQSGFHNNLGSYLLGRGRFDEAVASFARAIELNSGDALAYCNLGNALQERGRLGDAIMAYERAIAINPRFSGAYNNLGFALARAGYLERAIDCYTKAIALNGGFADAHYNLANVWKDTGRIDLAIASYQRAIECRPDYLEAFVNLGIALHHVGRIDASVATFERAIEINPHFAEAHFNLAKALSTRGQTDRAAEHYEQALALNSAYVEARNNLGVLHAERAEWDAAVACFNTAISIKSDFAGAHHNLSHVLLRRGEFAEGWTQYEFRWGCPGFPPRREMGRPMWDGAENRDARILLTAEQGLGDTLQFIRYAPLVAARCGRVIVECQAEIAALVRNVTGVGDVIVQGAALPEFDVYAPLLSLPKLFATDLATIPNEVPYIAADREKTEQWKSRLSDDDRPKIGIAWAGSRRNRNDRNRSMSPAQFAPLTSVAGVAFVSLQKEDSPAPPTLPAGMELIDMTADLHDFTDTAALIAALDLVICVDTAVAHLAGAMGRPVWTLLPFCPDWRWLLDRADSPWYPTMRLIRQPRIGDWAAVMDEAAAALREWIASPR